MILALAQLDVDWVAMRFAANPTLINAPGSNKTNSDYTVMLQLINSIDCSQLIIIPLVCCYVDS